MHAANYAAQVKRVSERNIVVRKGGDGFEENVKCKRNSFRSQEVMQVPSAVAFTADYPEANPHPPKNN